jgi:hypothetical protein
MSIWKGFAAPFSLVWNYSNLLAPARNMIREAEDWTDYACAAFWIVFVFTVLSFFAYHLSGEFILQLGAFAVTLVLVRLAWHYLT